MKNLRANQNTWHISQRLAQHVNNNLTLNLATGSRNQAIVYVSNQTDDQVISEVCDVEIFKDTRRQTMSGSSPSNSSKTRTYKIVILGDGGVGKSGEFSHSVVGVTCQQELGQRFMFISTLFTQTSGHIKTYQVICKHDLKWCT